MLNRGIVIAVLAGSFCACTAAQEATSGFSLPMTVSGDARYQYDRETASDTESSLTGGGRLVLYPTARFGAHWFAYSALDVHSTSYFSYETGTDAGRKVEFKAMQAFLGYTKQISGVHLLFKAGQVSSAFGLFPVDYDDSKMPLIDPPPIYAFSVPLRADQVPCGTRDILAQEEYGEIVFHCGGSSSEKYGAMPVTLFGLPGVEMQVSAGRFDGRFQVTNSSPVNPHGLLSESQSPQWAAGAGYTLHGGLHIGVSGFRGPYLDRVVEPFLPAGAGWKSYTASGVGTDATWARGGWSLQGEFAHFSFQLPGFLTSPTETGGYLQAKRILSPRFYLAARASALGFGSIQDSAGFRAGQFAGGEQVAEAALGYRLNRFQLLKTAGTWSDYDSWAVAHWYWPGSHRFGVAWQLVTSFTAVSKAFQ